LVGYFDQGKPEGKRVGNEYGVPGNFTHAGMKEHEREKTVALIESLHILDVTREIAERAGTYKRDENRQYLELDDCFIAATAFVMGAVLATGNGKHYPMEDIEKEIVKP